MKHPSRFLAALALAVFASACSDNATGPDIETSTVAVRAYVDANGTGVFDAGDVPVQGATVTLSGTGLATLTQETDATGLATFTDVPAGGYRASIEGASAAGAVLAGATNPVIAAPAFGDELQAEFRFVFLPGSVAGTLFRDNNGNGSFDAGDTPAPGIPVAVFAGTDVSGTPVATTTTDTQGAFSFEGLRPGSYTLVFSPFPTMTLVGGNTQSVTVAADASAAANVRFTGNLLSPISEARTAAAAGQKIVMALQGVVSWQPSFSDEMFIEDESGGILVFAAAADVRDLDLEPGDTVVVVGETNLRFGELQLTNVTTLTVKGRGAPPEGVEVTAAQLNAGQFQHQVVQVNGATVTDIDLLSFGNQFVTLRDLTGQEFGVYGDSRTGVDADTWRVGGVYDVSGVPGFDNRFAFHNRIEVRSPADVVAGEAPLSIAEAIAAPAGTLVTVSGTVTWQPVNPAGTSFNDELFIQDATGGIQVFARDVNVRTLGLVPGDVVLVSGSTEDRFGERQITLTTSLTKLGSGAAPAPVIVTPAQIAAGTFTHRLVRVEDATVLEVDEISFGNQLVTLRAANGTEFGVYVDSRVGVTGSAWTVGSVVDVTGVINYDNRYAPHLYRIWIRSPADLQPAS